MTSLPRSHRRPLVFVVEPHPIAARHLAEALKRDSRFEIILSDVNLATEATLSTKLSVLIVDADALPFPIVPFLHTIRTKCPESPILVIGRRVPKDEICHLLLHGARGFVTYDKVEEEICTAVDSLLGGHMWLPSEVLERYVMLSSTPHKLIRRDHDTLSAREAEIAGLLQRRLSDKEIGCTLGITERTVRFHLQNIFAKFGVHDRHSIIDCMRSDNPPEPESKALYAKAG